MKAMTEFKRGQRVRVEFEGTVELTDNPYGTKDHIVVIKRDDNYIHSVKPEYVKEVLDPENWPPQIGDIWEANGCEYFVRRNTSHNSEVVLVPDYADAQGIYSSRIDTFKALNPTLVRRRSNVIPLVRVSAK